MLDVVTGKGGGRQTSPQSLLMKFAMGYQTVLERSISVDSQSWPASKKLTCAFLLKKVLNINEEYTLVTHTNGGN